MTEYEFVTRWTDLYIKTYNGELLIQSFGVNLIFDQNEPQLLKFDIEEFRKTLL
jgi:hypothetical protein